MDRGDVDELHRHLERLTAEVGDGASDQLRLPLELFASYLDILDGRVASGLARLRASATAPGKARRPRRGCPASSRGCCLRRALAVARRQGARAFERRVRGTLAKRSLRHDRAV